MGYEANPVDPSPSGLERFLEDKYVWLFTCFILCADIGSALYSNAPLSSLRLDELDKNLPIGAILVFFTLFALLISFSWLLRFCFYRLTAPLFSLFEKKKSMDDHRRMYQERERHSVPDYKLRDYALENDNGALYDTYLRHDKRIREHQWTLIFQFIVGALLIIYPLLPTSTLHALIFSRFPISDWCSLVLAIPLIFYAAHAHDPMDHYVYIGEQAAQKIQKKKDADPV